MFVLSAGVKWRGRNLSNLCLLKSELKSQSFQTRSDAIYNQ